MANDLSKIQNRTTQQDRITRNRDAMFRRNDTDAPQRRNFADLRNASRGDGGAQALMEALGMVERGARSFQQYANNEFERGEQRAGSQGLLDAAAGAEDIELARKSRAYRESLSLGRAQRSWAEGLSGFDAEVQELLVNQSSPDPEERKAEVAALLDDYYKRFALDEGGQLKDFGSPSANRWLAEQMAGTRLSAMTRAGEAIDARMAQESITDMTATVRAQLLSGQEVDWSTALGTLLPTVDRKAAMRDLLTTVKDVTMTLEEEDPVRAIRILDGLLGFARTSGIETVDPGPSAAPASAAPQVETAAYVSPFDGFGSIRLSSDMGDRRGSSGHNGEDFPMPVGTEIRSPMAGEVIGSWRNARGGNQVRIRLDDGTIVGFAHLSTRDVKVGDRVSAGQVVARSGNTGKSTGPHLHATAERDGKKVSFSEVFSSAPQGGAVARQETPPVASEVLDPATPSELAAQQGGAQLAPPEGAIQLTPEQRLDLLEFRRSFRNAANARAEQERNERQGVKAYEFIARTSGVGAYPTVSEVQDAIRNGDINPQQGATILNTIEADRRQLETDIRQARSEADRLDTESREQRVESAMGSVLGPVYMGRLKPSEAAGRLLEVAAAEPDVEVRRAIISSIGAELNNVTSLRTKSPEYARAASQFEDWEAAYVGALAGRRLPRGMTREQAQSIIRNRLGVYASELGRAELKPDRVERYMGIVEPRLDAWFDRTFPRRTPTQ